MATILLKADLKPPSVAEDPISVIKELIHILENYHNYPLIDIIDRIDEINQQIHDLR